jgi:hypothetical protein
VAIGLLNSPVAKETAAQNSDEPKKDPMVRPTWAIFMVTAVLACVAILQLATLEKSDQTVRTGERAWVGWDGDFTVATLDTTPHLKVEAHAHIKNFGHGPALKVMTTGWFETDPKALKADAIFACDSAVHFTTGTVPHGPAVINPGAMGYSLFPDQGRRVDVNWRAEGQQNIRFFWLIACAAYLDQFGKPHWSRLVMQSDFNAALPLTKDTPLQFYSLYNDTDESDGHQQFEQ